MDDLKKLQKELSESEKRERFIGTVINITTEKERELQLHENVNEIRNILESLPLMAWTALPNGKVNYFSKSWCDFTGQTQAEALGSGWKNTLHPDYLESTWTAWRESLEKGIPYEVENKAKRAADGQYRWMWVKAIPIKNEKGEILQWVGTIADIDERKTFSQELKKQVEERTNQLDIANQELLKLNNELEQANKRLKDSEQQIQTIIENAPEAVIVIDSKSTVIKWNPMAEKIFGWSENQVMGKPLHEFIIPHRYREKHLKGMQRFLTTGEGPVLNKTIEIEGLNKEGILLNISLNISPTIIKENYLFIAFVSDVTKRKQMEINLEELNKQLQIQNEIFEHAEQSSLQGSYSFNLTTGILHYSDNLYRLIGYKPKDFSPALDEFYKHVHPDDREYVKQSAEKVLATQQAAEWKYRMISKTGSVIYIKGTGKVITSGNEKMLVGTLQDITTDTMLNESITAKNLELKHQNAELASFTYIASHDLQEPLRKIQTFTSRILEKDEQHFSEAGKDYFTRITLAANRMQNLIESLLHYSRTNTSDAVFTLTDLNSIVDEVKDNLHELIEEKGAIVESTKLPTLKIIPLQFHQLILNIITNGIKYRKPNLNPSIKITAYIVAAEEIHSNIETSHNRYWKISIADNGIGFEQQFEAKIFELFQRLHNNKEYEGTGIGLAICKKIVLNHKGFITANGQPGIGSTFNIYLPAGN